MDTATSSQSATATTGTQEQFPYTCIGCSLAFSDAQFQREHYQSDLHRYNAKRRVAGLGPVTAELFEDKIKQRHTTGQDGEGDDAEQQQRPKCKACNKTFNTEATLESHIKSKKHKENVFRLASQVKIPKVDTATVDETSAESQDATMTDDATVEPSAPVPSTSSAAVPVSQDGETAAAAPFESSGDPKLDLLVARRIRCAPPLPITSCLFCTHSSSTANDNKAHMRQVHSFALPEEEYLVDLEGLLRRLGEEIGTWNVCICCGKGYGGNINLDSDGQTEDEMRKKASKGVEAVRAHMQAKSHCRLRYDTEEQRLDLADFYDFRPSYPGWAEKQARKAERKAAKLAANGGADWEDVDGMDTEDANEDDDADAEVVYVEGSDDDDDESSSEEDSDDEDVPGSEITYGDSTYELVLPSGMRIGHRAHRHIHKQNLLPHLGQNPFQPSAHSAPEQKYKPSPHSQALLQLVPTARGGKDKSHSRPIFEAGLIPAKGAGFGGNGDVIQARNKGEAKNAGKATREFKELKMKAQQEFVRGIRANSQKHFRDPLLQ